MQHQQHQQQQEQQQSRRHRRLCHHHHHHESKLSTLRLAAAVAIVLLIQLSSVIVVAQDPQTEGCIRSTYELELKEAEVTDTSTVREYIFCENTVYSIGYLDYFDNIADNGMDMINMKPNLHIKCGASGNRTNNCIINGGDIQVQGVSIFDDAATSTDLNVVVVETLTNVVFTGLTFTSARRSMVHINKPGDIVFRDCEFRNNTAVSPILLDYYDPTTLTELTVTFDDCHFVNNIYPGPTSQTSLIIGNSLQNRIVVTDTQFSNNNMVFGNTNQQRSSSLIESNGPVELIRCCFHDNLIGVAPVVVYSATLVATDNFANFTYGGVCPLGAVFESTMSYALFQPTCIDFDVLQCNRLNSNNPPTAPTGVSAPTATNGNTTSTTPQPTLAFFTVPPTPSPNLTFAPTNVASAFPTFARATFSPRPSIALTNTTTTTTDSPTGIPMLSSPTISPTIPSPIGASPSAQSVSNVTTSSPTTPRTVPTPPSLAVNNNRTNTTTNNIAAPTVNNNSSSTNATRPAPAPTSPENPLSFNETVRSNAFSRFSCVTPVFWTAAMGLLWLHNLLL